MAQALKGKVVAITGGGRGIGAATAEAFARAGAKVAVCDVDLALAEHVAARTGGSAWELDVRDPSGFEKFLNSVEEAHGGLDVLVNNAGIMPIVDFVDETADSVKRQLDVNVNGVVYGTQLALRKMLPKGSGSVVNISSVAGLAGLSRLATYCGGKHFVLGFTESLRRELRGSGVHVASVHPGFVRTELTSGVDDYWYLRSVGPDQVADAVVKAVVKRLPRVSVPGYFGYALIALRAAPTRFVDAVLRVVRLDELMTSAAHSAARKAYDERVADLGADPR